MKNDDLTFEQIKNIIEKYNGVLTWSVECQMYRFGEREAAIIITCNNKGEVLSAFCRCGGKMKNFKEEDLEIAKKISDTCQQNPSIQKQIQMLQAIKTGYNVNKKR